MNTWMKAAGVGMLAGMRTMAALTTASIYVRQAETRRPDSEALHWLGSGWAERVLALMAVSEMVFDKLPVIPDRISPPALAGRAASGALSGAAIAAADRENAGAGALIGLSAAVASAYGSYIVRQKAGQALAAPDPLLGAIEDGLVVLTGSAISQGSAVEVK